jgi:hypothetical protein
MPQKSEIHSSLKNPIEMQILSKKEESKGTSLIKVLHHKNHTKIKFNNKKTDRQYLKNIVLQPNTLKHSNKNIKKIPRHRNKHKFYPIKTTSTNRRCNLKSNRLELLTLHSRNRTCPHSITTTIQAKT